ncbi:jg8294 [Pararge aegeria aegeria]|uniref:Jg8294 protein n=1 Tax=Pararge aegeria aegeria TaxID=348720 RepID=A0A8S4R8L8_9NEOP|nr:jg8294 [Pararge aegeria aegeria]
MCYYRLHSNCLKKFSQIGSIESDKPRPLQRRWCTGSKWLNRKKRAIEREMLGLSLLDRVPNVDIRNRTGITDIVQRAVALKSSWAGHMSKGGRALEPSDYGLATAHWTQKHRPTTSSM